MNKTKIAFIFLLFFSQLSFSNPTDSQNFNVDQKLKIISEKAPDLDQDILKRALSAFKTVNDQGSVNKQVLTVIDYGKASNQKRMWVIDLENDEVPFHTYVSHGKNSGQLYATNFSNIVNSKKTSLGTYLTANSYHGSRGYALRLQGLEKGINDNAMRRAIVIHGANYVNANFIGKSQRLGLSHGCPAISTQLTKPIIDLIKGGSVVYAFAPDKTFLNNSEFA